MHCLEYVKAGHGSEMLAVLFKYFAEKERLRVGGLLLPQLIEFYMWLTEDVCHLLTIEQASSKPIAELVTKIADSYAEEKAEHIKKLFENVRGKTLRFPCILDNDMPCVFLQINITNMLNWFLETLKEVARECIACMKLQKRVFFRAIEKAKVSMPSFPLLKIWYAFSYIKVCKIRGF